MTDLGYEEVKSDAQQVFVKLRLAIDAIAPDWLAVNRLTERLNELSHDLYHETQRREGLARVKAVQPFCQE